MNENVKKKDIWSLLLACVVVLIAALTVLLVLAFHNRRQELDLTAAYVPRGLDTDEYTFAEPFTADLVVSEPSVSVEGVTFHTAKEKGLLFNLDTKKAVFAQGVYDKAYPASITKLMTAILAARYADMSQVVVMEESDFALEEGSQVSGLLPGDTVTMEQLFYALVVYSANDAANAIARCLDGSVAQFVDHMNREAQVLGMKNTHFENPHGLHSGTHYTCAYDIYLMLNEALRYQVFLDAMRLNVYHLYVQRDGMTIAYDLSSTDKYMTGDEALPPGVSILGGKTGTTDEAGSCLCLAVQNRAGTPFVAVVLNAENKVVLYDDMGQLLQQINQA